MPHGFCYLWDPWIVWLHVISDGLIAFAYYCIPPVLLYFIRKQRDMPFNRLVVMFGAFILSCGTSHLMEVWDVWHASYLFAGVVKAVTAVASLTAVIMLLPLIPQAVSLPGRLRLQDINTQLQQQIAERKLTEFALQRSLKELADQKFALDQHAIVAVTDVQGTITYVNDKFCAISKYSREELQGSNHRILNSGHHPREFFQHMYRTIAAGKVWHGEIKNRAKDGSFYWVDTTIVPTINAAGKPEQYVAIRADVTERKLAELALQKQTEELARSNRDLEQFAYAASHDLQEPLRAVSGCMQLFKARYGGKIDARGDEFISHAVEGADRMRKLIDDLLSFSRVGTRGVELHSVPGAKAVEDALKNLTAALQEPHATVECGDLPCLLADVSQLTLLFQNLIGNALKFRGPQAPRIHIGARQEGDEWVIAVRDNGIGIEPQYFERIFVIFQRLHTRTEYPGTGMGLALCKRIVERHGGRIWVESELGNGATFCFSMRGAQAQAARVG